MTVRDALLAGAGTGSLGTTMAARHDFGCTSYGPIAASI